MLAYTAGRQRIAERRSSPSTMLFIAGAHVAAIAFAMTIKMAIDVAQPDRPIIVRHIPLPTPDPEPTVEPRPTEPTQSVVTNPRPIIESLVPKGPLVDDTPVKMADSSSVVGTTLPVLPQKEITPLAPVRVGPRLATPERLLRPPYPSSKLDSQEEAALRLRLTINEQGRVVSVEPAGPFDPAFLTAARRHLLAKWRYQPGTVDGRPIASSTVITLRFELEG